jgi:hydantoinase/carbamoylase family amidase
MGLTPERDRAGNIWVELRGESDSLLVLGSHLDSVPAGGWLDGALGVWAGLAVLEGFLRDRRRPQRSVAVVDWADEEGARFGRSLYGSSAFAGALEVDEFAGLLDRDGHSAAEVLGAAGISLDSFGGPDPRLERIGAYLELHIEQGPILVEAGEPVASVTGTVGIKRDCISFEGQSAHAGPTPMEGRADAFLAAAEVAVALEELARRSGGRATNGRLDLKPGIPTATAGRADLYTDLRHEDPKSLEQMHAEAGRIAEARASSRGVDVTKRKIWSIEPRTFDSRLIDAAREACVASGGSDFTMPSGALHDAAELAPLVPTAMIFCASQRGLSHCPEEDSTEEDLECAIRAFDRLARSVAERSDLP